MTETESQSIQLSSDSLERYKAELAIINRVQEGLVKQLDFQAIIDLVGDELLRTFPAPKKNAHLYSVFIALYDPQANLVQFPYWRSGTGKRFYQPTIELGLGLTSRVIRSRRPVIFKTWEDQQSSGVISVDDGNPGEFANSWLGVPILIGDRVTGAIALQDPRKDLYTEADARLLSTLAASLGVSLENARLFDETQRLLKDTEQRNAELAIINSVQEGLASKLDMQEIYDLVCDKIRQTFSADVVGLVLYDEENEVAIIPHMFDHGQRYYPAPQPVNQKILQRWMTRQPVLLETWEEALQFMTEYGLQNIGGPTPDNSHLYVPFMHGDKVMGVMSIAKLAPHAFNEQDVRLLQTLVNSMSVALENARLFDETQRLVKAEQARITELEIINSIQQGLAAELDFQAIVDLVGDKLSEVLQTGDLGIRWYEEKTNLLHNLYLFEHGKRITLSPGSPVPGGVFEQVRESRQPLVLHTAEDLNRFTAHVPGTDYSKSGIAIPIISSDRVLGAISVENYERENAFGESEVRLLTTIAASLGSALENARLFDETQRLLKETEQRNAELAIINSVQAALAAELDIQGIYDAVGDKIREIFQSDNMNIRIFDEKTGLLSAPYVYENGQRLWINPEKITEDNPLGGFSGHVLKTRKTLVINENMAGAMKNYDSYTIPGTLVEKSAIFVPLVVGDQAFGLVNLSNPEREHAFSESDVRLLETLVNSMSVALENARLFDETERLLQETEQRNAELAILNSVSEALSKNLNVDAITKIVGDEVRDTFKAEVTTIHFYDPKNEVIYTPYYYDKGYVENVPPLEFGRGMVSGVIQKREPVVLLTVEEEEKADGILVPDASGEGGDTKSYLGVPIIVGDQVIGVVSVQSYQEHAFQESHVSLLSTLASTMGVAIANARQFQAEQERVAELQIINSVQQGLAAELDFQAIIDLVGDKLREVLRTGDLSIRWYEEKANLLHNFYSYEHGKRLTIQPHTPIPGGTFETMKRTHQPVVFNMLDENMAVLPGTDRSKSEIHVPIVSSDRVLGVIIVEDFEHENAFGDSEIRLLTTIAASLGTALENARLFDETQRLFKAEQDRVAELQIINSIQQGLAKELDFQAIVDLVGDKLREVFRTPDLFISWFEEKSGLLHQMYAYEHGKRLTMPPRKPSETGPFSRMVKTHQPVIWNTAEEGDVLTSGVIEGTDRSLSGVMIPYISNDRVLGVIQLENYEQECAFGEAELRLLTTIAASLGAALENARLFDETQRLVKAEQARIAELEIINSVQQGLAAELDFQAIINLVGDKLREVLQTGDLAIGWYEEKANLVHYFYLYERGKRIKVGPQPPVPGGAIETMKKTHQPYLIDMHDENIKVLPGTERSKSEIHVPIISSDRLLGSIISEDFEHENAFGESEIRLLTTIAASLGTALENARLFDETQRLLKETEQRNAELAIINSVQAALGAELDIQGIYDAVGDKIREIFNRGSVGIRIFDPTTNVLYYPYTYENGQRIYLEPFHVTDEGKGKGFTGYVMSTRETLVINENMEQAIEKYGSSVIPGTLLSKSDVYVPLVIGDQAFGVVVLSDYEREHAFSDADVRLLQTLVNSMSVALENARLFDETQRLLKETEQRNAELAILNSVSDALSKNLNVDAIIKIVGDQVRDTFKAEVTTIHFYDPKTNLISTPYGYDRGYIVTPEPFAYGEGLTSIVVRTREPLVLLSAAKGAELDSKIIPDATGESGDTNSYLGVPIIVGDKVIGVVTVQSYQENAYQQSHISLLSTLASTMGVAIANARQFQAEQERVAELEIINSIQKGLAAELDFQAIVDLVGDKLREVFKTGDLGITWFDEKAYLVHYLYTYEHGKRFYAPPAAPRPGGIYETEMKTRQPYVVNAAEMAKMDIVPGTDRSLSAINIPIISSDRFLGDIAVEDFENENAFGESEIRLLTTIAASLGTALENARLFNETQRLLKETEQRAAELAILNSVGDAMSSQIDIKTITHLVGDKVREIFASECVVVNLYDPETDLLHPPYIYDRGYVDTEGSDLYDAKVAEDAIYKAIIKDRKGLLYGTTQDILKAGGRSWPDAQGGEGVTSSFMGVPIFIGEQVKGLVSVQSYREHAYDTSNLRLLSTMAASMGVAIENARLFQETQRLLDETEQRAAELQIINSVQAALAAELNIQGIYNAVGDKIREIFHSDNLGIRVFDPHTNLEQFPYTYENGVRVDLEPMPRIETGFSAYVARTRETLVINENLTQAMEKLGSYVIPGTQTEKSAVYVPLVVGDQVRGLVALADYEKENAFSEPNVRLLQTLVNSMSVALENARLFNETQRLLAETEQRNSELAIINSVQAALAAELNIQGIYDAVGDKIREIFHSDNLEIRIWEPKTGLELYPYIYENGERIQLEPHPRPVTGFGAYVARTRETVVINEDTMGEIEKYGSYILPGTLPAKSMIYVPLIVGDQARGMVGLSDFEHEHAFSEPDVRLLQTLVNSMSVALENARLFNETQRLLAETEQRNSELAIINSVQAALAAELNIQGIYDAVGDKIREIFHSDNLEIRIFDTKTKLAYVPYIFENGVRIELEPRPFQDVGIGAHLLKTRETLVINENMLQVLESIGSFIVPGTQAAKSSVYVPLIVGDQVRGLVGMSDFEREHAFDDADVRLLQTLVNSMSVALENARLFNETQRLLAETEQRNSELAIINSVQAALAAELNIQGIYEAVGDKIREIFHSDNLEIRIFNPITNQEQFPYLYEQGERVEVKPLPRAEKGFSAHIARTRETIIINENVVQEAERYGSYLMPGTGTPKSVVYVPLIVGDQVRGLVGLSDFEREGAFGDSDVRLLQTLVNSMSVALENARLFAETQRLLEETSQRASELAIINSVTQSMSSQLQVDSIVRTVGDQVRDTLHSDVVNIYLYDQANQMIHLPYSFDRQYVETEPFPYGTGLTSKVIDTKQPMILGSFKEIVEGGALLNPNSPGDEQMPQSYLGVPIVIGDKAIGVIDVQSYEQCVYDGSHVRLLTTLASSMGVALENARLFEETQRLLKEMEQHNAELAVINRVQQALASKLDLQDMIDLFGNEIMSLFPPQPGKEHNYSVFIALYDAQTSIIQFPYLVDGDGVRFTENPAKFGAGLTSQVIRTSQPLLLNTLDEQSALGAVAFSDERVDMGSQSWLGVPILKGDQVIGVFSVQDQRPNLFTKSDVRLLSTLASSLGVALENARLFEETRRLLAETEQRNRELAIISRVGQALAGQLDPQGIFELVGEELQQVFDAHMVGIVTYDRQENMAYWRYFIEKGQRQSVPPQQPVGFSGHILRTREPILITHDIEEKAKEYGSILLAGELPKSYLGVPLIAGGEVTGVITLQNMDREEAFSENDLRLLSTLALSMGVALENARLYQETQHHAVEMATLAEIGSDIASTHEMEPVLERMATKTRELMQVRDIAMYLLQPDGRTLKPIVSQGKYAAETMAHSISLGQGMTGSVAQKGIAEIINEPEHDPRAVHIAGTPAEEEEPECLMIAPLISRGKVIGVIAVYRDRDQGSFTQLELDFLVSLARQAAIAIESARLYTETERRATEMAALAEVSREISATLELQVVLERIASEARELLAAGNSAVYLLQPDGVTIRAIAAEGDVAKEVMEDEVQLGNGIIGSIVKSGVAEWVNDTSKDARAVKIRGTEEILEDEKLLVAPLLIQDRAIGALAVWRDPDDPIFDQAELNFSINMAQQAVVAIENARLFESAQESQRRMADIIDFLPDATFVVNSEGKVIAWNHAIEEMTGVRAADIVGKGDFEYALPFYGERRPILIDDVLLPNEEIEKKYSFIQRSEGALVGEAVTILKNKKTYLNATASALKNSRGEVVGAIESIRDITEQKLAEQELHQAKVEAEAANQAKSAFLAMMSHEIRTPMNAIIGMSGLLMDTQLNPDQREFAETIRSSGDSLLTIINDILDFSKIEAGKMTLEEVPFDLRECVEASLDLMKVRASEKALELAYQIDPGVPPAIIGDVTRLRQVLINLLGNSVKFTEQGEVILTVSPGEEKNSLHFSVRDTGIGIPPERFSLLFKAFTQADTSTSRRYGGTGLGLALSTRIVELMGGRMWVESEGIPGKGSTFHFIIFAKPAPDWKGHSHMEGEHPQLRGKRLLVVDDNATNRRILQLQTQVWGMLPHECASPAEAMEILSQGETFDLAIIDMNMPDMSGVELADEIRKLEARKSMKRMILVLSTSLGGREEARESAEFAAILLKPIRQSALFDMLMTMFARKPGITEKPAVEKASLDPEMAARHPLRILLAEDNVVNQKLALRLLSQMGYRADVAANGLEVLQAVKRQPYDVILMDVQMPEMDGLEATRRLCAEIPTGKRPRIIAMTANAMQGDREMCLQAGMDDYLSKPIRVEELVAALYMARPLATV